MTTLSIEHRRQICRFLGIEFNDAEDLAARAWAETWVRWKKENFIRTGPVR
jgi:hypothetical protein